MRQHVITTRVSSLVCCLELLLRVLQLRLLDLAVDHAVQRRRVRVVVLRRAAVHVGRDLVLAHQRVLPRDLARVPSARTTTSRAARKDPVASQP